MVGSNEGRAEEDTLIVRVGIDAVDVAHDPGPFLVFGAGKEENIALHAVDI